MTAFVIVTALWFFWRLIGNSFIIAWGEHFPEREYEKAQVRFLCAFVMVAWAIHILFANRQ